MNFTSMSVTSRLASTLVGLVMSLTVSDALSRDAETPDCPLRDSPFSTASPLMDILRSDQAKAIANRHFSGALDQLPEFFASTQAPSFSAILTLEMVAAMGGLDRTVLEPMNAELMQLAVTDADRRARCARYDDDVPAVLIPTGSPRILVFEKMTGFRDGPSVEAASAALVELARTNGWSLVSTDRGGAMRPEILQQFDVVLWNNVSGDVLTLGQRKAFEDYINGGGGYVGIHGSAGDPLYFWDWYVDELIGARFIGHPMDPQFQDAHIKLENNPTGISDGMEPNTVLNDEWYSFRTSARAQGAMVVATLDESTYSPIGRGGQDVRMGNDHPIAWSRCVGSGRAFYSAIGHRPAVYGNPWHLQLLTQAINWAASTNTHCQSD